MTSKSSSFSTEGTLASGHGILCLGLPRTGSYSIVNALNVLGFERIHHGVNHGTSIKEDNKMWTAWGRAGWACLPYLRNEIYPDSRPRWLKDEPSLPFTREDWDKLVGNEWQGVSDIGAIFAPDLIKAYPEAKVILVERDVEKWVDSFDAALITPLTKTHGWFVRNVVGPVVGIHSVGVMWDFMRGYLQAKTDDEMRANLRERYREHYAMVRATVPPEQLLVYKLGEGWEPLCKFLDRPVPEIPFPRLNDRQAGAEKRSNVNRDIIRKICFGGVGVVVAVVVIWALATYARPR